MRKIRILLADDHIIVREGLRACLAEYPQIMIVGEASDGKEAVQKVEELKPDVVLMDLNMPVLSGLTATSLIKEKKKKTRVLVLTVYDEREYIVKILDAGGDGYLLKDTSPSELVRGIEAVHRGDAYFSPAVSRIVLSEHKARSLPKGRRPSAILSRRELEVVTLIAEGFTNKEIANTLFISERTVTTHRERIMKKLDVHSAGEILRYALAHGIVQLK